MTGVLGVSVASQELRAVLADRAGHVLWAASMPYGDPGEIITAIGRLAADCPGPAKRVRVVLERAVVQLRTRTSVPRLRPEAARRYVALERPRLFRQNGAPLVSDGQTLQIGPGEWVLWAGAAPDPLVAAVVRGCDEAGLALEALGPAADVLPHAVVDRSADGELVFPNGATCEVLSLARGVVWRSRFTAGVEAPAAPVWTPALRSLGDRAGQFAAAFAAATRRPRLQLLPADTLAVRRAAALRRLGAVALAGAVLWVAAAAVHGGRLAWTARTAQE